MTPDLELAACYAEHIQTLQARTQQALAREGIDGLIIHSGQTKRVFLDDTHYPFVVNPHFKAWLPLVEHPNCWLIVNGQDKPKLIFYQPKDFWHKVHAVPQDFWTKYFDIQILTQANAVEKLLPFDKRHYAYIGEYIEVANALGFDLVNPDRVMHYLHFYRGYKTDYEQQCLRRATEVAILGHNAAYQGFHQGQSELDINHAYLQATQLQAHQLPYSNIIGLNQNGAILHYTHLQSTSPERHLSMLIDAGASFNGYAADITRTYSAQDSAFNELIAKVQKIARDTVARIKPNMSYLDVHLYAYQQIGQLLIECGVLNMSQEQACETQVVSHFFPHGIGHLLGLQVHDMGGYMLDDRGTSQPPPEQHPFLRSTRLIEPRQAFTIEPGVYFIESLLQALKASSNSQYVNWQTVEHLRQFGGVRIEDNIIVHRDSNENITVELGLAHTTNQIR